MDEDVLQALLTQFIGTSWAVQMKSTLRSTRFQRKLWKQQSRLTDEDEARFTYYTGKTSSDECVAKARLDAYQQDFFMAPLPNKFFKEAGGYDNEDELTGDDDKKSPKDVKQLLLRTLATEVLMRRALDGEAAIVQSDFQWFATGIAHSTIFAVMRFVGFQEEWITFFKKVLEPPLNMLDGTPVRTRQRGLPMAHVFEKLLGELVLYFMDLAVAQDDGMILYRFHDDLWLAGKPKQVADSWKTMEGFARVMGLEFNEHKTGGAYLTADGRSKDAAVSAALPTGDVAMNFLRLDPDSGEWRIDQSHVQEHVASCISSSTAQRACSSGSRPGIAASDASSPYTFGEPAHRFGKAHLDAILTTHIEIQRTLFPNTTVIEHAKSMITSHFPNTSTTSIPNAFISMPELLGGLGLKNPFIPLLLLQDNLQRAKDPSTQLTDILTDEREIHAQWEKSFLAFSDRERRKPFAECFPDDEYSDTTASPLGPHPPDSFPPLEHFTTHREPPRPGPSFTTFYSPLVSPLFPSGREKLSRSSIIRAAGTRRVEAGGGGRGDGVDGAGA